MIIQITITNHNDNKNFATTHSSAPTTEIPYKKWKL